MKCGFMHEERQDLRVWGILQAFTRPNASLSHLSMLPEAKGFAEFPWMFYLDMSALLPEG